MYVCICLYVYACIYTDTYLYTYYIHIYKCMLYKYIYELMCSYVYIGKKHWDVIAITIHTYSYVDTHIHK